MFEKSLDLWFLLSKGLDFLRWILAGWQKSHFPSTSPAFSWQMTSLVGIMIQSWLRLGKIHGFQKLVNMSERKRIGEKPARGNASKPAANSFENHIAACSSWPKREPKTRQKDWVSKISQKGGQILLSRPDICVKTNCEWSNPSLVKK